MINVIFQATLTEDPTTDTKNTFQSAHVYLKLAAKMAVNDPEKTQYKKTLFMQGSVWGKQAEVATKSLKKGSRILVFGDIYDIASNQNNGKIYTNTTININRFEFLDKAENSTTSNTVAAAPAVTAMNNGYASAVNMAAAPQQMAAPASNVQPPAWTMAGGTTPMAANFF